MRINKQVIKDYFGSFFTQYKLNKEQFNTLRNLVDNAECGCCQVVTFYWPDTDDSTPSPANQQVQFTDVSGNIIAQTSLVGTSPQRICVPRDTDSICINITEVTNVGGSVDLTGSNGTIISFTDTVGLSCVESVFPADEVYIISTAPATP